MSYHSMSVSASWLAASGKPLHLRRFTFGLFGRYYWEVLLECFGDCLSSTAKMFNSTWKPRAPPFLGALVHPLAGDGCRGQCLERACAVPSGKRSTSHFLRIVLFARAHAAEVGRRHSSSTCGRACCRSDISPASSLQQIFTSKSQPPFSRFPQSPHKDEEDSIRPAGCRRQRFECCNRAIVFF